LSTHQTLLTSVLDAKHSCAVHKIIMGIYNYWLIHFTWVSNKCSILCIKDPDLVP
jgi:hypothetical protein